MHYLAWPTLLVVFIWLAWRNFRSASENWRVWRRNLVGLGGSVVFIVGLTSALYHRAWELVIPLESEHGPARLVKPPTFKSYGGSALAALLPDRRLWVDRIAYAPNRFLAGLTTNSEIRFGKLISLSGNHIVPGSNWIDAVATFHETVAVRSDGSLWISEKPLVWPRQWDWGAASPPAEEPAALVRFGNETNWQSVIREYPAMVLLKQDGTLWRWGTNLFNDKMEWPGLRAYPPRRLGTDSDWAKVLAGRAGLYAWKKDGSAWTFHSPTLGVNPRANSGEREIEPRTVLERLPGFDNLKWQCLTEYRAFQVGLLEDGTLWAWNAMPWLKQKTHRDSTVKLMRIGQDNDWIAVAGDFATLTALKADGSLWKWDYADGFNSLPTRPPFRLGRYSDWVAVGVALGGSVSLAADGSLWHWWDRDADFHSEALLAVPGRPARIENIFDHPQ